jgi:hypothetical protein
VVSYVTGFVVGTALIHAAGAMFALASSALATTGIPARITAAGIGAVGVLLVLA